MAITYEITAKLVCHACDRVADNGSVVTGPSSNRPEFQKARDNARKWVVRTHYWAWGSFALCPWCNVKFNADPDEFVTKMNRRCRG